MSFLLLLLNLNHLILMIAFYANPGEKLQILILYIFVCNISDYTNVAEFEDRLDRVRVTCLQLKKSLFLLKLAAAHIM